MKDVGKYEYEIHLEHIRALDECDQMIMYHQIRCPKRTQSLKNMIKKAEEKRNE